MFNIFEQPWLLFAAAFIVLIFLYISTLERKFYWQNMLILILLAVLNLVLESRLLFLNPKALLILKIVLPILAAVLSGFLILGIIQLKDKTFNIWLLPLILIIAAFCIDWLFKTDAEKINLVIRKSQQAVQQEDSALLSSILSEQYQDSFHSSKQALLRHFNSYFEQPLCDSVTKTYMQTNRQGSTAVVELAVFIAFNPKSFPVKDYEVSNATVSLRLRLRKEKDNQWRIYETEITSVNSQPFSWSAVGR